VSGVPIPPIFGQGTALSEWPKERKILPRSKLLDIIGVLDFMAEVCSN
jgi:hypothetical protein